MIERSWVRVPYAVEAAGEFSSPGSTFGADFISVSLPQYHVKDPYPSAKSASGSLQLTHMMHPTFVAWTEVPLETGAWLYGVHRTCADTAAVSRGTSHVTAM